MPGQNGKQPLAADGLDRGFAVVRPYDVVALAA